MRVELFGVKPDRDNPTILVLEAREDTNYDFRIERHGRLLYEDVWTAQDVLALSDEVLMFASLQGEIGSDIGDEFET